MGMLRAGQLIRLVQYQQWLVGEVLACVGKAANSDLDDEIFELRRMSGTLEAGINRLGVLAQTLPAGGEDMGK